MENLLQAKSGLLLNTEFYLSRVSSAIAGPWSRGFPPLDSWTCTPFFGWNPGWGWFGLLLTFLFWAAVIGMCALVIKRIFFSGKEPSPSAGHPAGPLDILKLRYARGEISREEYTTLQKDLRS